MLHTVAAAHPKSLSAPAPLALCVGFSNDALEFELRVWTANFEDTDLLRSDLAMSGHAALRGAGTDNAAYTPRGRRQQSRRRVVGFASRACCRGRYAASSPQYLSAFVRCRTAESC